MAKTFEMLEASGNIVVKSHYIQNEDSEKKPEDRLYKVNGIPSPLHFYYLNSKLLEGNFNVNTDNEGIGPKVPFPRTNMLGPVTQSPVVMSMLYVPFMKPEYLKLHMYDYDQEHYGPPTTDPKVRFVPCSFVLKVIGLFNEDKPFEYELGNVDKYKYSDFRKKKGKHWSNESKLFQYPYHFVNIHDYMNAPLEVRMELIEGNDLAKADKKFKVKVRQSISISGSYTIYVPYLKGDADGNLEGMKSFAPMDLPTSSSQYSQYIANNKAQHTVNNVMSVGNALLGQSGRLQASFNGLGQAYGKATMKDTIVDASYPDQYGNTVGKSKLVNNSSIRSAGKKALAGIAMDATTEIGSRLWNAAGTVIQNQARKSDMMNAPRNVTLQGGDVMDSITNGKRKVEAIRYHIKEEYLQRLGDFFAMYGYKQNKLMKINLRSRKDYNYIKTINANITGTIPKKHIESLKAIFDNGITLWHMDRNGGKFIDYSDDNTEV